MNCPECEVAVQMDWATCPYCSAKLNESDYANDSRRGQRIVSGTADPLLRFFAFMIDAAIVGVLASIVTGVLEPHYSEVSFLTMSATDLFEPVLAHVDLSIVKDFYGSFDTVGGFFSVLICMVLYHGIFEGSASRATIGKMVFGFQVTDYEGYGLGYARSFGRAFMRIPSLLSGVVTLLCVLFTDGNRALHDFVPGSYVRG